MCGRHLVDTCKCRPSVDGRHVDTWGRHLVDTYKYWYGSLSMKDTYVPQTRVLQEEHVPRSRVRYYISIIWCIMVPYGTHTYIISFFLFK